MKKSIIEILEFLIENKVWNWLISLFSIEKKVWFAKIWFGDYRIEAIDIIFYKNKFLRIESVCGNFRKQFMFIIPFVIEEFKFWKKDKTCLLDIISQRILFCFPLILFIEAYIQNDISNYLNIHLNNYSLLGIYHL